MAEESLPAEAAEAVVALLPAEVAEAVASLQVAALEVVVTKAVLLPVEAQLAENSAQAEHYKLVHTYFVERLVPAHNADAEPELQFGCNRLLR